MVTKKQAVAFRGMPENPHFFDVWTELTPEQLEMIEGVEIARYSPVSGEAHKYIVIDPRYDVGEVKAAIDAAAAQ